MKMGGGFENDSVKKTLTNIMSCVPAKVGSGWLSATRLWNGSAEGAACSSLVLMIACLQLDRWSLSFAKSPEETPAHDLGLPISDSLPLDVVNNYFSFGSVSTSRADAETSQVAL